MIDEVGAHRVVPVHHHRNLQLCSDTVRARNKHGFFHTREVASEHAAEGTDIGKHAGSEGFPSQFPDPFFCSVGIVDIDACVFIRYAHLFLQARFPQIQLPVFRFRIGHRVTEIDRILAGVAGGTKVISFSADGSDQALEAQITQGVRLNVLSGIFLYRMTRGDQFLFLSAYPIP